jgi:hypothetical protein
MSGRPKFLTEEDILRYSNSLDNDPDFPKVLFDSVIVKEVCIAGLWLCEELEKLSCPETLIVRIQYTAGKMSFGNDPWDVHQKILEDYKNNKLVFEDSEEVLN